MTLRYKFIGILLGVGILAFALIWGGRWLANREHAKHDQAFDRQQQELIQQRDELAGELEPLKQQRDAAIQQAQEAEARAESLQHRIDLQRAELAKTARRLAAVQNARDSEAQRYARDTVAPNLEAVKRCEQLCQRAKAMGLIAAGDDCGCR